MIQPSGFCASWIEEVSRMRNKLIGKVAAAVTVVVLSASTAFAGAFERVAANRTDVWRAYVFAGVEVTITVDGDDDTDLDLEILNGRGNQIVIDCRYYLDASVRFTPTRSGYVEIR